jgi:cytoskeletal protein RodZ
VVEGQITTPEIDKIPEPSKVSEPEPKKITEPKKTTELKKTTERETKKVVEPVKSEKIIIKPVPKIVVAPAPAEAENSVVPIEQLKRRPLHLVFLANTWAEVIDARGGVLLSRNNSKGSEKWVGGPGRAPYDISIGRPSNVKLYYKGKEIDLSAYAGMDVARLKVE